MFSRKVNEISLHSHPWHLQPILHTEAKVIFKKKLKSAAITPNAWWPPVDSLQWGGTRGNPPVTVRTAANVLNMTNKTVYHLAQFYILFSSHNIFSFAV